MQESEDHEMLYQVPLSMSSVYIAVPSSPLRITSAHSTSFRSRSDKEPLTLCQRFLLSKCLRHHTTQGLPDRPTGGQVLSRSRSINMFGNTTFELLSENVTACSHGWQ